MTTTDSEIAYPLSAPASLGATGSPRGRRDPGETARDIAAATQGVARRLQGLARVDPAALLTTFGTTTDGLTESEAARKLVAVGPNEVTHDRPPGMVVQFARQLTDPFIVLLTFLAAIMILTTGTGLIGGESGDWKGPITLAVMIGVSASLRFWQEHRSNTAADRLKAMVTTSATVRRRTADASTTIEVPFETLVPGDVVVLAAGDLVPADVRLLSAKDLYVSQSALTGEALPVEKHHVLGDDLDEPGGAADGTSGVLDLSTLCLMGTSVTSGRAEGVVVGTGTGTYFGSMARGLVGARPQTSFDRGIRSVSVLLIRFMLVMVPVVFFLNGMTKGDWAAAFFFAVAVAVGLTPEMLPLIVTANLARGAVSMSKRKVIVKHLNSIQNFGAMDVLCTDKTGTLTEDRIVLQQHLDLDGREDASVLSLAYLNSAHQTGLRNLLDRAVIEFAHTRGDLRAADGYVPMDEIPFDFSRRRMSVVVANETEHLLVTKGAVEETLAVCSHALRQGTAVPLDAGTVAGIETRVAELNAQGLRVLAVASRSGPVTTRPYSAADEHDLVLAGLLTFLDPPKATARAAVAALDDYGVTVKVITGDSRAVAIKVCCDVGLPVHHTLVGAEIDSYDDDELIAVADATTLFAKVDPLQKARIVRALQAGGHTVGYLGDGINDAAALRDADVGVSVDTAVDIAKESADIVLLEKDLMVLEQGVIEGRRTFGNVMKYIKMTASSNFGNVVSVLVASAFLPFEPMLAVMILVQNLLYDISQLSIPWDRMDDDYLRRPRRWESRDLGRFMVCIGPISSIFDITTFLVMWFVFRANSVGDAALFQSGWFVEGLLSQTLVVHMIRTRRIPLIESRAALPVMALSTAVMAIGIYLPFSPIADTFGFVSLPGGYFPILGATLLAYCALTQYMKTIYIRRFQGAWL